VKDAVLSLDWPASPARRPSSMTSSRGSSISTRWLFGVGRERWSLSAWSGRYQRSTARERSTRTCDKSNINGTVTAMRIEWAGRK
jgi:hypothetical protein